MIDRTHQLPISRQAEALGIARSTVYALPRPVSDRDLQLMKRIDRLHLEMPFAGSRMLRDLLAMEGIKVGRKHVRMLMKRMGIEALYRKPLTTRKHPHHPVYPYLLRGLTIDRPNQVWAMDLTYYSNGSWLRVSGGSAGLALAQGTVLAGIDHNGRAFLPGGGRRSHCSLWGT
jgi:putative transposase